MQDVLWEGPSVKACVVPAGCQLQVNKSDERCNLSKTALHTVGFSARSLHPRDVRAIPSRIGAGPWGGCKCTCPKCSADVAV